MKLHKNGAKSRQTLDAKNLCEEFKKMCAGVLPKSVGKCSENRKRPWKFSAVVIVSLSLIFNLLEVQLVNQHAPASVNFLGEALIPIFGLGEDQRSISIPNSEIYFVKYIVDAPFS